MSDTTRRTISTPTPPTIDVQVEALRWLLSAVEDRLEDVGKVATSMDHLPESEEREAIEWLRYGVADSIHSRTFEVCERCGEAMPRDCTGCWEQPLPDTDEEQS